MLKRTFYYDYNFSRNPMLQCTRNLSKFLDCFFWVGLFLLLSNKSIHAGNLQETVQKIQKRYQSISSFSGSFVQVSFRNDSDLESIKAGGKVSFLRPGMMRWEYQYPDEQLLVTDGETLWLYDPLLENVTVQELSLITKGTVLDFLLGVGDLLKDFIPRPLTRKIIINKKRSLVVELEPKDKLANLEFIQLQVDSETYYLKKLLLMDQQGNHRTISLSSMNYNLNLEPLNFKFEVPKGMEILKAE